VGHGQKGGFMKWIKLTDEQGQVVKDRLPQKPTESLLWKEGQGHCVRIHLSEGQLPSIIANGWTHYALITGPNEPQPEDGLVEALRRDSNTIMALCNTVEPTEQAFIAIKGHAESIEQNLAQWEAVR
jgi:hypothetical protein